MNVQPTPSLGRVMRLGTRAFLEERGCGAALVHHNAVTHRLKTARWATESHLNLFRRRDAPSEWTMSRLTHTR